MNFTINPNFRPRFGVARTLSHDRTEPFVNLGVVRVELERALKRRARLAHLSQRFEYNTQIAPCFRQLRPPFGGATQVLFRCDSITERETRGTESHFAEGGRWVEAQGPAEQF